MQFRNSHFVLFHTQEVLFLFHHLCNNGLRRVQNARNLLLYSPISLNLSNFTSDFLSFENPKMDYPRNLGI